MSRGPCWIGIAVLVIVVMVVAAEIAQYVIERRNR